MLLTIQPKITNTINQFATLNPVAKKSDVSFEGFRLPKLSRESVKKALFGAGEWGSYLLAGVYFAAGIMIDCYHKPHALALTAYAFGAFDVLQGLAIRFFGDKVTKLISRGFSSLKKMIFRR